MLTEVVRKYSFEKNFLRKLNNNGEWKRKLFTYFPKAITTKWYVADSKTYNTQSQWELTSTSSMQRLMLLENLLNWILTAIAGSKTLQFSPTVKQP